MLDFSRYALYDARRTTRLTLEPMGRAELLSGLPGELVVTSPVLAAMLGAEVMGDAQLLARREELSSLDEDSALRLWLNPFPAEDGRTVFISTPDALPEVDGTPDWSIRSAGFLIGPVEGVCDWVRTVSDAESADEIRRTLSAILSGTCEPPHAAKLVELSSNIVLQRWPVRCGNPIRSLSAATQAWPEVRYPEEDFVFRLREDALEREVVRKKMPDVSGGEGTEGAAVPGVGMPGAGEAPPYVG